MVLGDPCVGLFGHKGATTHRLRTTVLGDLMLSSGLCKYQAHTVHRHLCRQTKNTQLSMKRLILTPSLVAQLRNRIKGHTA